MLLQDHHLREKIMHFDHERIPERVVHTCGAAPHGTFVGYGTAEKVCKAAFLGKGTETPVFVRFSTVVGLAGVHQLRDAIFTGGMVPLLIAPHGGTLDGELEAQPTFLTARSVEFDALLLSASPPPAPDARPSATPRPAPSTMSPPWTHGVLILVPECFRHAKAIVLKQIMTLLSTHRVWERFSPAVS